MGKFFPIKQKMFREDRTAAEKKLSQKRPAAGVESGQAGFHF